MFILIDVQLKIKFSVTTTFRTFVISNSRICNIPMAQQWRQLLQQMSTVLNTLKTDQKWLVKLIRRFF